MPRKVVPCSLIRKSIEQIYEQYLKRQRLFPRRQGFDNVTVVYVLSIADIDWRESVSAKWESNFGCHRARSMFVVRKPKQNETIAVTSLRQRWFYS